jgi:hypothetical protein
MRRDQGAQHILVLIRQHQICEASAFQDTGVTWVMSNSTVDSALLARAMQQERLSIYATVYLRARTLRFMIIGQKSTQKTKIRTHTRRLA